MQFVLVAVGFVFSFVRTILSQRFIHKSLNKIIENLNFGNQNIINSFQLPIIMVNNQGAIIWYNRLFRNNVLLQTDLFGKNICDIITGFDLKLLDHNCQVAAQYKGGVYDVYISLTNKKEVENDNIYIMFFIDVTEKSLLKKQLIDNQPTVIMINIDSYEDIVNNSSASEKNKIINDIELIINDYFKVNNNGIIRKIEKDLFIAVQEKKYVLEMIANKFSILNKIKAVSDNVKIPVTLSIGIGLDSNSINESEQFAKQSLDMALGRGGDQVAIKRNDSFEFFGGTSLGEVKSVKVKTRVVASSLKELIEESENVVIMGHKFADLDCLGAAIGMAKGVQLIDSQKDVYIVLDKDKNVAQSLLDKVNKSYDNVFILPDESGDYIGKRTLLIILDTHVRSRLESVEVYQSCKRVVVIDHHRKMVDHINDAVIFYHEPSASSACEMVTELVQYFSNKKTISNIEADALLSGIMLDTRNFVFKTGVRTFEAAAYLKRRGANTIEVKKLFSSSMESYKKKMKLVSVAKIYKKCAISVSEDVEDLRVVSAQAADELLTINDVDASFVIYRYDGQSIISARSMGTINVQIIMEFLGGGGHLTMAGAQIKNLNLKEAEQILKEMIDKYYDEI